MQFANLVKEARMKRLIAVAVLLMSTSAQASVGGGEIIISNKGGAAVFSHEAHVQGAGLKCTECHDKLYLNKGQHKTVTMKQMQKGQSCGFCHNGKKAFSVKGDCSKCHKK